MDVRRQVRFPALVVLPFAVLLLAAGQCNGAPNRPPVADAGEDQTVGVGELVTLDGSGSSDPDGDPLLFVWELDQMPDRSAATLSDAASPAPSFTADSAGSFVATLMVADGELESSDSVLVTVAASGAPVADAGEDQTVGVGELVTLDGSGSSDPDGDPLSFFWELETVPDGSGAVLSDAATPAPSFTADSAGSFVATLTVSDGELEASDSVSVTASGAPNEAPRLSRVDDQRTLMNEPIEVAITIQDEDPDGVTFEASSSDATLVADGDMVVLGGGAERVLRIAPAPMGLGTVAITLVAQDARGLDDSISFVLEVSRPFGAQVQKLTASDAAADDRFGASLAISGDYAVIGAPLADDDGANSGSAYVFRRSGGEWAQSAKLPPAPPVVAPAADVVSAGDQFGGAVAIDGGYVIVGALLDDTEANDAGAAYIYERCRSTFVFCEQPWNEMGVLTANDAAAGDRFGRSVAISVDHAVVGAHLDDDGGEDSGSAYVYRRSGDAWSQVAKLTANDAAAGDWFGLTVAIDGDHALVGAAPLHDDGPNSGSAYMFRRSGDAWAQVAKLTANDAAASVWFGTSVAISGDHALIGDPLNDDMSENSGSAYVFRRSGDAWSQVAKLTANDADARDWFGWSVAISGDYAIIGAYQDDDGGNASGSAYVFQRTGDSWNQTTKLTANDAAAFDQFGRTVAISGDHALVGAHLDDDDGASSGSGYAYLK